MKNLLIRLAQHEDVEAVKRIEEVCHLSPWSRESYLSEIERENSRLLIAEESGVILGFVLGRLSQLSDPGPVIELLNIASAPSCRRKGVGRSLLEELIAQFKTTKPEGVLLEVRVSNEDARGFYEKHAFVLIGRRKGFYSSPTEDACTYFKSLSWA